MRGAFGADQTGRDPAEESLHYLMISMLADSLEAAGFVVRADHIGKSMSRPAPIGEFVPDIEAIRGEELRLIEVETQSTLASPRSHLQISRFVASKGARVYLAVPSDCTDAAKAVREGLSLDFDILPCYPFVGHIGGFK